MIDFNSKSRLGDRINHLIDEQIDAGAEKQQRREYLGASVVGHECERAVQFHLLAARGLIERKKPAARNMRIFDRGHTYEEKARQWLLSIGFLFGRPRRFEDFDGQFRGHIDGALVGWDNEIECMIELPALWECKCLGSKYWKKLKEVKLKACSPTYWAQVHIYMHYLQLNRCLFTAVNADTMEIEHQVVEYDHTEFELARARVAAVIAASDAGQMVPRVTADRNYYICRWCDYSGDCWG